MNGYETGNQTYPIAYLEAGARDGEKLYAITDMLELESLSDIHVPLHAAINIASNLNNRLRAGEFKTPAEVRAAVREKIAALYPEQFIGG